VGRHVLLLRDLPKSPETVGMLEQGAASRDEAVRATAEGALRRVGAEGGR